MPAGWPAAMFTGSIGTCKAKNRGQRTEVREQKTEKQKTDYREQKTENRGQIGHLNFYFINLSSDFYLLTSVI